jgi:hypothetical protein
MGGRDGVRNVQQMAIVTGFGAPYGRLLNTADGSHKHDEYREKTVIETAEAGEYRHTAGVLENRSARSENRSL